MRRVKLAAVARRAVARRAVTRRAEQGSATFLMLGVMVVVMVLGLGATVLAGYFVCIHRARAAADLSALSGASSFRQGGDPCAAARLAARRNGAAVVQCEQVGDIVDFVVTVRVRVDVDRPLAGLPRSVGAVAHAGPVG